MTRRRAAAAKKRARRSAPRKHEAKRDVVVVGASAGGVEALTSFVKQLPADLDAAVFVVLHVPNVSTSVLPRILTRAGKLRAEHARDGGAIHPGRILVAPPGFHLLLVDGHVRLSNGPEENGVRPAIDPLFRSAARVFGPRVIGVVLSGVRDDGTAGLAAIKMRGGLALVQDPSDAIYGSMPASAIENVEVDHILPVSDLARVVAERAGERVRVLDVARAGNGGANVGSRKRKADEEQLGIEDAVAAFDVDEAAHATHLAAASGLSCPKCNGVLFDHSEGPLARFRCHVGHAYSIESLAGEQARSLDDALWTAYRALRESAAIARRLAERARASGRKESEAGWDAQAQTSERRAAIVRRALERASGREGSEEGS